VQSIAFKLGPITVHWYGVMMALAFIAGLWTASRRCKRDGIAPEKILDLGPWLIIGAIIGARILYVFTFWREQFAADPFPEIFMVQHGGLVYYGGLIGASLACILYSRIRKVPLWKLGDIMAPSIALGYVFGRIGCLMNGCCYGRACSMPWAIRFPEKHATHPLGMEATPVHPTQIYDSLLSLLLYLGLAWLYRRKKFDGQVFGAYLVCYALTRSFVEYFRGDYPAYQHFLGGWATPAQLVSIGILFAGVGLLFALRRFAQPVAK
jgi:phosphatidylglycerol:prolipoprotein diacylglycerol transferase